MRTRTIIGVWAVIAGLLFWNGVLALGVYKPFLGPEAGEMMAVFVGIAAIFGASRPFFVEEPELSRRGLLRVSMMWLVLTAVFEIALGWLAQVVVPRAAPTYGMWDGSFWPLIVLAATAAPSTWLKRTGIPVERVTK
jgi:hypothetical protein